MGGMIDFYEAFPILNGAAQMLPVNAIAVENSFFEQLKELKEKLGNQNINPLSLKYLINNNFGGCKSFLYYYDSVWHGKYV